MEDQKITQSVDNIVNDTVKPDEGASTSAPVTADSPAPATDNISSATAADTADSIEEALKNSEINSESNENSTPANEEAPKQEEPEPEQAPTPEADPAPTSSSNDSDLESVKKKALSELEPIIDELDLPAEEKFQTILMIIQSSDRKDLIEKAYEAADKIEDKKLRAQALLSVVKEIDYFEKKTD
jgi:hypothetical protein